ncbi:L-carnitine dehydratase/bile acid-inducible protein F (plasmid) [Cupriavidus sp. U2]|uniref:CaiB/BaiF CoA transferase family protein n=1 Tax=Cupriavidus sp. U2 TaxID=2920269 RepID=UPI00129E1549|nr:CaiB/BaiF CoA-transferase family protein [Cupriavidus sp. U2]KAI3590330.1 L-carnitine dehydratase/bile acid-inducible protein F [Cupriavidus sp. U2]
MSNALSNLTVLDLSRILAGPWATQNLADLGADVIKVEKPGSGDDTRHMGPPFFHDQRTGESGDAAYFMCCNRGKRSVTIDFTTAEGQELMRLLVARADVLVENYKVGTLAKYGLDFESLRKINPRLVYCSVTGFGQFGPYKDRAGYDYLIQGMGGLMSVTGEKDELPGGGPQRVGVAVADLLTGMYATVAILAALRKRDSEGVGQHIDISLLDCQVGTLANQGLNYLATGTAPVRMGSGHPNIAPYQVYPALDGHIILAVGNDVQFRRLCEAIGEPHRAFESQFSTIRARVENRVALNEWLTAITVMRTVSEWVTLLEQAGVPCGPINSIDRVFEDPHVIARGMQLEFPHPKYGPVPSIRNPIVMDGQSLPPTSSPPVLGQHTQEVLRSIGVEELHIHSLAQNGII